MTTGIPFRIDSDLYEAAARAAEPMGRSISQQIAHWARIGRELELNPAVALNAIASTLAGRTSVDDLGTEQQVIVRAFQRERKQELCENLRLDLEFEAKGQSYVELDDDGEVVWRHPEEDKADGR